MIKRLTTKNFRKLRDHVFEFGPGLQVVRGSNEAGKSTMLEAITYALFGIKACRSDLAGLVTWGEADKTLKVEVVLAVDDVEFTISRGKSGAEINYEGGKVVGQSEVTAFIERAIGAGTQNISRLMMASQGSIRGALDQGPQATMALIESLANFDVIDRVIELVQEKRVTGPTATAEDRVGRAQEAVAAAEQLVVAPDTDSFKARLAAVDLQIAESRTQAAVWEPKMIAARGAVTAATAKAQLRLSLLAQKDTALALQKAHQGQADVAKAAMVSGVTMEEINALDARIAAAGQAAALTAAFNEVSRAAYPEAFWEGDEPSFQVEIQRVNEAIAKAQSAVAVREQEIAGLKKQRQTGEGACKSCGQMLPNAEAVAAHNAKIDEQVQKLSSELPVFVGELATVRSDLAQLLMVQKAAAPFYVLATKHAANVAVDWGFVPPKVTWSGPVAVSDGVGVGELNAQRQALKARVDAAAAAGAKWEALQQTLNEDAAALMALDRQIADCGTADDLPALEAAFEEVAAQYNFHFNAIAQLNSEVATLKQQIATAEQTYAQQKKGVEAALKAKIEAERDLQELHFNNALLKRVRAARPIIADKLWSIVLSAVSSYFSAMRGEVSTVTREAKSFKVDGQEIGGLSGSTLDILGLAIRLALTRTFLPTAPFLILDEPAAAMDENRAQATLGFLVAAGFPQTLLVTHEEMSESVAQGLITL